MFKKILLGTDGSEDALKAAALCARMLDADPEARLVVIYVHRPFAMAFGYELGETVVDYGAINDSLIQAGKKSLAVTLDVFARYGDRVEGVFDHGDPGDTITEQARNIGADLVVVGSRGLSGVASVLMGSVSTKVVHTSPCPVLVVR